MSLQDFERENPFFVSDVFAERWDKLTIDRLETTQENLAAKIDAVPRDSVSLRESMLSTFKQLDFYLKRRRERDDHSR